MLGQELSRVILIYTNFLHLCGMIKTLKWCCILLLLAIFHLDTTGQNPAAKYKTNQTVSYKEAMDFYRLKANNNPKCKIFNYGFTDIGKPLDLFVISNKKIFNREKLTQDGATVILINNGIHPGEPDGIDACIKLTEDILSGNISLPDDVVLAIIPIYNIDGALNLGCCSRANQNGPLMGGFRGNARNLDLNRDFIKCDSENAKSFTKLYQAWDPDVFVDTHVSDGADYTYTMTLIDSQKDKLSPAISKVMTQTLLPALYDEMKKNGNEICPYVNVFEGTPDQGIEAFLESPRFATGYAALFHAFPFVTETHMLKPFPKRVEATYEFLKVIIDQTNKYRNEIIAARKNAKKEAITASTFPIEWKLDSSKVDSLFFKGYAAKYSISEVTGLKRLYYDTTQPYEKNIPFFATYIPSKQVKKPSCYIVPQAWREVIERMNLNGIEMNRLKNDTTLNVEVSYIRDYKTGTRAYEGHYLHSKVVTEIDTQNINYFAGDYLIYTNQWKNRYIVETLEPEATDAFFVWNFFDEILQQKEWFSDYLFEEKALKILNDNPNLWVEFEKKKQTDLAFSKDNWAMLTYIYQRSEWYEKSHLRYPIARLIEK
jgi:hypothetical protein